MCERKIQLGPDTTKGLGAGARPDVGAAAAEETLSEINAAIDGSSMIFITAGMGGGTGTGAAPVIARTAREAGALAVGVVSKPFDFEGAHRMKLADDGIEELSKHVDTLIVIPNQNLFLIADDQTTFADAFRLADDVLHSGVRGVTDLIVLPGLINLDFADIRSTMTGMGKAVMGTGVAKGENRAQQAAEAAISNPLLDDVSVKGARNVLINITGGPDLALVEVDQAANRIRSEVAADANIIFGSAFDANLDGAMRVSVIATGKDTKLDDQLTATGKVIVKKANGGLKGPVVAVRRGGHTPSAANDSAPEQTGSESPTAEPETTTEAVPKAAEQPKGETETKSDTHVNPGKSEDVASLPPVPEMHYVVCDLAVGVRLYKVPLSKVAQVRNESHADRMQIFDELEKAKSAADNLSQRIAYRRAAEGLPELESRSPQPDYERWTEKDVPLYFF